MTRESTPLPERESSDEYSIHYRETPEFKWGLHALEESELNSEAKMCILAVALNLKRAAEFEMDADVVSAPAIEQMLGKLGVHFFDESEYVDRDELYPQKSYLIGATEADLQEVLNVPYPRWSASEHEAYGQAMDYPAQSRSAWEMFTESGDKSVLLDPDDSRLTDEEKAFSFFRMSSDSWEAEIPWLEQLIAGVRAYSPRIYDEVMGQYRTRKLEKEKGS